MGGLPCGPPLARMSRFRYAGMCSPPVRGSDDAFPSVETARLHHAPRRCGARMAARLRAQVARRPKVGIVYPGPAAMSGPRVESFLNGLRGAGYGGPEQIELVRSP